MILFFDTETTGLPKNWKAPVTNLNNWPRLVQLAYLVYDFDGNLIHSCNEIVKPNGFTIPIDASNLHGITTDIANQRGSKIEDIFELFHIHLKRAKVIVAHNMAYDEKIIGSELIRLGLDNILDIKEKICTMESSIDLCKLEGPYGFKWPKLEELHRFLFKYDFEGAHDAMADIQATAKCFWELKNLNLISLKIESLKNNIETSRRKIVLNFNDVIDENGNKIKVAFFEAILMEIYPSIFSDGAGWSFAKEYKLVKVKSVDLNGNEFIFNDVHLYLNHSTTDVIEGNSYKFKVTRRKDEQGVPLKPFIELVQFNHSYSESPLTNNSSNVNVINSLKFDFEYLNCFSNESKNPDAFYSNFLYYPFFRPPKLLWFDGSINQENNHFGCKEITDVLKSSSEGYGILISDINDGLVKNFSFEVSCNYFKTILEKFFPKMIFNNVGEYEWEKGYPLFYLMPNILLYDKKSNIHVAINIDSPYDLTTKKPKKYVKYDEEFEEFTYGGNFQLLDYYRDVNLLFSESFENPNERIFYEEKLYEELNEYPADFIYGPFSIHQFWFSIKFSEHQVILYPYECCKFIQEEIYRLTKIKLSDFDFSEISPLKKINMWTEQVAINLSKINFREKLHKLISISEYEDIGLGYKEYMSQYKEWKTMSGEDDDESLPY